MGDIPVSSSIWQLVTKQPYPRKQLYSIFVIIYLESSLHLVNISRINESRFQSIFYHLRRQCWTMVNTFWGKMRVQNLTSLLFTACTKPLFHFHSLIPCSAKSIETFKSILSATRNYSISSSEIIPFEKYFLSSFSVEDQARTMARND